MNIELHFSRVDNAAPWGFRLTGGAEYDVPLTVTKVMQNSIAEKVGLRENDVIVRVNSTPISSFCHAEAHDLLIAAGNDLILAIRRENDINANVYSALRLENLVENKDPYTINKEINNNNIANEMSDSVVHNVSPFLSESPNNFSEAEKIELRKTDDLMSIKIANRQKSQKWSTFLQKPTNEIPCKNMEIHLPKEGTYKVVIKKQKKTCQVPYCIKKNDNNEEDNIPEENESIKSNEGEQASNKNENVEENEENLDAAENGYEKLEDIVGNAEEYEERESSREVSVERCLINEERKEEESEKEEEDQESDEEKPLELQLVEVQKQLAALSQVPSTVQETLDSLTKQLARIVQAKLPHEANENDNISTTSNSRAENKLLTDEEDEEEMEETENLLETKESLHEDTENEKECEYLSKADDEDDEDVEETEEKQPLLTEEELARIELERQIKEKQVKENEMQEEFIQRRLEQRPTMPLKPKNLERPIILPGGRRWSQPDDACKTGRVVKMTDEKIANTIEIYSEVISGRTKGINFLKYQPTPKNLDYLQQSEVYKMIHDAEPTAVRGIGSRSGKVLAAEDYYQNERNGLSP